MIPSKAVYQRKIRDRTRLIKKKHEKFQTPSNNHQRVERKFLHSVGEKRFSNYEPPQIPYPQILWFGIHDPNTYEPPPSFFFPPPFFAFPPPPSLPPQCFQSQSPILKRVTEKPPPLPTEPPPLPTEPPPLPTEPPPLPTNLPPLPTNLPPLPTEPPPLPTEVRRKSTWKELEDNVRKTSSLSTSRGMKREKVRGASTSSAVKSKNQRKSSSSSVVKSKNQRKSSSSSVVKSKHQRKSSSSSEKLLQQVGSRSSSSPRLVLEQEKSSSSKRQPEKSSSSKQQQEKSSSSKRQQEKSSSSKRQQSSSESKEVLRTSPLIIRKTIVSSWKVSRASSATKVPPPPPPSARKNKKVVKTNPALEIFIKTFEKLKDVRCNEMNFKELVHYSKWIDNEKLDLNINRLKLIARSGETFKINKIFAKTNELIEKHHDTVLNIIERKSEEMFQRFKIKKKP